MEFGGSRLRQEKTVSFEFRQTGVRRILASRHDFNQAEKSNHKINLLPGKRVNWRPAAVAGTGYFGVICDEINL